MTEKKTLMQTLGSAIWNAVEPWAEAKWQEVKPELFQWVKDQFHEWMPILVAAAGKAVIETGTRTAVAVEDKVTDLIPGELDDKVFDPMFQSVMQWVNDAFKGLLPPKP